LINGVRWAKRNLGAIDESDYGNYYTWEEAKNRCPDGWRLPTKEEFEKLSDAGNKWTTVNGVVGRLFGIAPNQIFLPASGWRNENSRTANSVNIYGDYWSGTLHSDGYTSILEINDSDVRLLKGNHILEAFVFVVLLNKNYRRKNRCLLF
jgi:uncharacterized protein (TIGR02145 family)